MKERKFYTPFQRVTVLSNGVPISLNAEVEVTIKRPPKLDAQSTRAWDQLAKEVYLTAELIPGAEG